MEERKSVVTTVRRGNTIEVTIESNSPKLKEFCDMLRARKMQRLEELHNLKTCTRYITLK